MKKSIKITIIDYDNGNLESVYRACDYVGMTPIISSNQSEIDKSDAIILPGVGAFGDAMKSLKEGNLIDPIYNFIKTGKIVVGICLGMQLFLNKSEESSKENGLGLIEGECLHFAKFFQNTNTKVPQIQWNTIYSENKIDFNKASPFSSLKQNEFMFFVHSFFVKTKNNGDILSLSKYGDIEYCSALQKDNIIGMQFHPEKSGPKGLEIYENIKNIIIRN
jgi:glutamine amidotransferase